MSGCNATLTTLVHTDEVVVDRNGYPEPLVACLMSIPDGATVTRRGDRLYRDEVHEHVCIEDRPCIGGYHLAAGAAGEDWTVKWVDDTPGATPHVDPEPPLVTDEEVKAALNAYKHYSGSRSVSETFHYSHIVDALEAAARVRQNNVTND